MKKHIFVTALLCFFFVTSALASVIEAPERTEAEIAKEEATAIAQEAGAIWEDVRARHEAQFIMTWQNPRCSPQAIFDAFGTKGVKLFDRSYKTQLFLKDINSDYVMLLPPYEYTISEEGRVTVGAKKVVGE